MSESAARIKCSAKINNEERFISGFEAYMAVNEFWPRITLESHVTKEAYTTAVKLGSFDAAEEMGKIQNIIFTQREQDDFSLSISVEGGSEQGNNFSFSGLLIGSDYSLSSTTVNRSDSAISKAAWLSALNFDCSTPVSFGVEDRAPLPSGPLPTYIFKCAEHIHKKGYNPPEPPETLEDTCRKLQKEVNQFCLPFFEQLMKNSVQTMGWEGLLDKIASGELGDSTLLTRRINDILAGGAAGGFETAITQFNEEFQCVYVPEWDGVGKLVNRLSLIEDAEDLSVVIISARFHTTNGQTLFPIKYTAVIPPANNTYGYEGRRTNFYAFPKDNVHPGASMIKVPGPAWLSPKGVQMSISQDGTNRPTEGKDVKDAAKVIKQANTKASQSQEAAADVLETYAKAIYVFQSLAGSYVELYTTLQLKLTVGKCYNVKSGDAKLFKGVLWKIRHSVSTGGGQSPSAISVLEFHIVQMTGFQLPGI